MGSPCELLVEVSDEAEASRLGDIVSAEAWRIEDKFSRYRKDNLVDRINRGERIGVDDETANLLDFAATLHDLSGGRFDITSGVLREVWTFDGSDKVPTRREVDKVRDRIGWHRVDWRRPTIRLLPGMQIDLGGVAKEYAVDRAAALLKAESDTAALVNFGGDLVATGAPSGMDGWEIGIDATDAPGASCQQRIRLKNGGLATSGDARRFLIRNGRRYSHILDPASGWPVEGAPRSVTVAADTCTQAGMLATLAMLRGESAEDFLAAEDVRFWAFR